MVIAMMRGGEKIMMMTMMMIMRRGRRMTMAGRRGMEEMTIAEKVRG